MGEAEGAKQTDAVIFGGEEAVADDDGAADEAGLEEVGSGPGGGGAGRLRKLNWLHFSLASAEKGKRERRKELTNHKDPFPWEKERDGGRCSFLSVLSRL